jgi:16S rRNA (cytosine1402-N4)-methyltransferase
MKSNPQSEIRNPEIEHVPVLLREAIEYLAPQAGGVYVDGTLGAGGHTEEILRRSAPDGAVVALDRDVEAVERSRKRLSVYGERAVLRQANFRDIDRVLGGLGIGAVDGVLLDLGVSWFHLKTPERGFSFLLDGPLDMRMDRSGGRTAADLVSRLPREELARVIREYGEEQKAGAIARAIEKARARGPITSTVQLAEIISSVFPPHLPRRIHPATLTFQALRIAVNDEVESLREGLRQAHRVLKPGGRMVVISFHSLEDRVVKQLFASWAKGCTCPPRVPVCVCGQKPSVRVLTKKPVLPSEEEVERNPAARSAKLRAAEKIE